MVSCRSQLDLYGNRRGQSDYEEVVDAVGDAVLGKHALRGPADELGGGTRQLVGQHNGGLSLPRSATTIRRMGMDSLSDFHTNSVHLVSDASP